MITLTPATQAFRDFYRTLHEDFTSGEAQARHLHRIAAKLLNLNPVLGDEAYDDFYAWADEHDIICYKQPREYDPALAEEGNWSWSEAQKMSFAREDEEYIASVQADEQECADYEASIGTMPHMDTHTR